MIWKKNPPLYQVFYLSPAILGAIVAAVGATFLAVITQVLLGKTFDFVLAHGQNTKVVAFYLGVLLVLTLLSFLATTYFESYLPIKMNILRARDVQNEAMNRIISMPVQSFAKRDQGYFYNIMTSTAPTMGDVFYHVSIQLISCTLSFLVLLGTAYWIKPIFALLVCCYVPVAAVCVLAPTKAIARVQERAFPKQDANTGIMKSNLERKRSININQSNEFFLQKFLRSQKDFIDFVLHYRKLQMFLSNLPNGLASMFQVVLLGFAVKFYLEGSMTLGSVLIAYQVAGLVQMPLVQFFNNISHYRVNKPHIERMRSFCDLVEEPSGFEGKFTPSAHLASFEEAKLYANGEKERLLFAAPHMTLPQKGLVVIKGANGSGKSMLVNYLTGFGDASAFEGSSELNENLQKASYLTYPLLLTKGSFTDNLFGKGYDQEVATMLGIDFFEKEIDDEKVNLSFGEGQKLNLLRVLSSPSPVVVLDEPFTNLDKETIARLTDYLLEQKQNKAIIAITHSPELDAGADAIYAIRDGQLVCEK